MEYRIVVDSCGELTDEMKKSGIYKTASLSMEVDGVHIQDDESFDQADFLKRVAESSECPKSSCPSPEKYMELYHCEAERVYAVTLSAELSGSHNRAELGRKLYEEEYGRKQIHVFNSRSASVGESLIALKIQECEEKGMDWQDFWKEGKNNKIYMCHGKDNIVFHSIILNALLLGQKENYHLVDTIVSAEYLNFNDQKFSKSKGIGMTALEACDLYDSDSIRYHLISNGPERKDTNFTIEDFKTVHNTEILNKFGNLVNRTLNFKDLEEIPEGKVDSKIENLIKETYKKVGENIENLEFKAAVQNIMDLVEVGNKYYDTSKPWVAKKENIEEFNNIIYTCSVIIANLSNLFEPIMPTASQKIREYLNIQTKSWEYITIPAGLKLDKIEPLFERMK